jgi:predicted nucleic acid-binding protein
VEITNTALRDSIAVTLDYGEAEVITLAKELRIDTVIIDEYAGRRYAKMPEINVVGALGILLKAKELGFIQEIKPLMALLLKHERYIDKSLHEKVLCLAGEL